MASVMHVAYLIYITMLIYGMMVMRGVMEEKTNRIAEVIVSSVKPFQLMMGKIIGIGAVGLTQFLMWIVFIFGLCMPHVVFVARNITASAGNAAKRRLAGGNMAGKPKRTRFQCATWCRHGQLGADYWLFYLLFFRRIFFYASLFAAIGSVVEDVQNSQSLTLPITMPIIFSFIIMTNAVQNPDTSLAIWASIIPFSSSMVMMARIAYGVPDTVPYWQLLTSMFCWWQVFYSLRGWRVKFTVPAYCYMVKNQAGRK